MTYTVPNFGPENKNIIIRQLLQGGFFNISSLSTSSLYGVDYNIDAIWNQQDISYSINNLSAAHTTSGFIEPASYVNFTPHMTGYLTAAFELWDDIVAINLNSTTSSSANIALNFSSTTQESGTYARTFGNLNSVTTSIPNDITPNDITLNDAEIWFNSTWQELDTDADYFVGSRAVMVGLHEIGHALGLQHGGRYDASITPNPTFSANSGYSEDTNQYTVMSYFAAGANGNGTNHVFNGIRYEAATPLLNDIFTLQAVYGADFSTRQGNTTYGFNSTAGNEAYNFSSTIDRVVAIWDGGGIDTIDVSGWNTNQIVNLNNGTFSSVGHLTNNLSIAYSNDFRSTIENAIGGSGNDILIGNAAANQLTGGAGADTFEGGAGNDVLNGGAGFDTASYAGSASGVNINLAASIYSGGDAVGDTLTSIEAIVGSGFADTITGSAGDDTIEGGAGNDILSGGSGIDTVSYAGSTFGVTVHLDNPTAQNTVQQGIDTISGFENILGSSQADSLWGDAGNNVINGGAGFDYIVSGGGTNALIGGDGGDTYVVQGVNDVVTEAVGGGYDVVLAQTNLMLAAGSEVEALAVNTTAGITLTGNEFQQTLSGNVGNDTLNGGGGNDLLISGAGTNTLVGGSGSDIYYSQGVNDIVTELAGGGFDVVLAAGNLTLAAGSEVEVIAVDTTSGVTIVGSDTNQTILGGAGNDRFIGGLGNDSLTGSGGADTFVLRNTFADRDFIADFVSGTDKLEISAALFGGGLAAGVLSGAQFLSGAGAVSATTAAQRFIYNSSTGNLLFDADGNGAGAAVLFANLSSIPTLTAADFLIAV